MQIKELSNTFLVKQLKSQGLSVAIGPFNFSIKSVLPDVIENFILLYADFPYLNDEHIIDFHVEIRRPNSIRRWMKPQVQFYDDQITPFEALPLKQAFPLLEWGMNWTIAQHSHQYLMIHSAVLEKNGHTVMLPAESGSGKSTLCALLTLNGWRLLSDEMALISTSDYEVSPICRPISLKNESINIIKEQDSRAIFSDIVEETNKGTIAHMKPPSSSVSKMMQKVSINSIVFPKFDKSTSLTVEPYETADAFMAIAANSFNYAQLGELGFETVRSIIESSQHYNLRYSSTSEVLAYFDQLANHT